jgi:CPA1 family monovalent cation:H+ antiporter
MALSLPADVPQRALLQEITFGVVLFTLLVQGTTIGWVVDRAIGGSANDGAAKSDEAPA